MPAPGDHRPDDTTTTPSTSLADDLLTPNDTAPIAGDTDSVADTPPAAVDEPDDSEDRGEADDDYLDFVDHKRSRVTTGLIIALVFAVGVLFGALITRTLAPAPQPQIVYVLNKAGHSDSPRPAPTPTNSPR